MEKDCGILLHISSLPSPYAIGDLGQSAYDFADFLHASGQSYWQVLPLGPTSYGDSPYQSPSAFAGNPYFISLDFLYQDGLITRQELESEYCENRKFTDYGRLFDTRLSVLKKAFARFDVGDSEFSEFKKSNADWLNPYALFAALKNRFGLRPHWQWDDEYRDYNGDAVKRFAEEHKSELDFACFLQFEFDVQWRNLKQYVNSLGIKIIGDAPIYAAYDSADFFENPRRFAVDENSNLTAVAGVPPDYFSADGQLWGNPLYNWDYLRNQGYDYWIKRIERQMRLCDRLRIDHFRGFCAYYSVAADAQNARNGEWKQGPGIELFKTVQNTVENADIIAEDLGVDSQDLRELIRVCGYPGMKVLQFGYDGEAAYNAHAVNNFTRNTVGYTGTHDNDTAEGWFNSLNADMRRRVKSRLPRNVKSVSRAMICSLYGSKSQTVIVPMQDWLGEGSAARMNTPGVAHGNWRYRIENIPDSELSSLILGIAAKYKRSSSERSS